MSDFKEYWKKQNTDAFTFEKAEALSLKELEEVRSLIAEKQNRGWISSKIITELQKQFEKLSEKWKAERAYWTEVKKQDTEVIAEAGDELEIQKYKVLLSPHPCEICIQKTDNGEKIFTQEDVNKTGYGEFVPWHPNCVTGDTRIIATDIEKLLRANYSGKIIKISFSHSGVLSVTPNHMVLTNRGFRAAKFLCKGDKIITSSILKGIVDGDPNYDEMIPTASDFFDTASKTSGVTTTIVPVSPEYLHSDARFCNDNIDIISSNGFLGDTIKSFVLEHIKKASLDSAKFSSLLDTNRSFSAMLLSLALAADGIVGSLSISDVLVLSSSAVDNLKRLFDSANYHARLDKVSADNGAGDTKMLSDTILTLSPTIQVEDINDIEVVDFHGYIYDITTKNTVYTTNGVISSNCYCLAVPVVD